MAYLVLHKQQHERTALNPFRAVEGGSSLLTEDQIEKLVKAGESAARVYITSKLHRHEIEDLDITVEVEVNDDLAISVEVNVDSLPSRENCQELVDGAVEAAHAAIKQELDKSRSRS